MRSRTRTISLVARFGLMLCIAAFLIGALPAAPVYAVNQWTVSKLTDTNDGSCTASDCSLREAIAASLDGDTIDFAGGGIGTINLASPLVISKAITINGPSTGPGVIVSGNGVARVFTIGANVAINYLTIRQGSDTGITINNGAALTLTASTVIANTASISGGGINNLGTLVLKNATVTGNTSAAGAGIASSGTLTIYNSTIAGNTASGQGGGLFLTSPAALYNSIIADNTGASGLDCFTSAPGELQLNGYNVVESNANCTYTQPTLSGTNRFQDPKLGTLVATSLPTQFYPLQAGSVAINLIPLANSCNNSSNRDQRLGQRPSYATPLFSAETCDAGAVEMPFPVQVSPAVEASNVARTSPVQFTSSMYLKSASATASTFAVHGSQSGRVQSGYSGSTTSVTLTPAAKFFPGDVVQVSATTGILDTSDLPGLSTPLVWQFRTATGTTPTAQLNLFENPIGTGDSRDIALGDYNADGWLDLMIANPTSVALRRADKTGHFPNSGNTTIAVNSTAVNFADFDGNGRLDLLITDAVKELIYLNNNTNNFLNATVIPFNTSTNAVDAGIADVDGDGDLDVIVVENGAPRKVFKNDGTGAMTQFETFGSNEQASTIAMADIDRDGDMDAVIATKSANIRVYKNDGTGHFTAHSTPSFGANATSLAVGDLNNDSYPDVAITGMGGSGVYTYLNNKSGAFISPFKVTDTTESTGIGLGDWDGDGDLDMVVTNMTKTGASDQETMWSNDGTGKMTASPITPSFDGGMDTMALAVGDINNDGRLDVAFANGHFSTAYNPERTFINDTVPTTAALTIDGLEDTELTLAYTAFSDAFTDTDGDVLAALRVETLPDAASGKLLLYAAPTNPPTPPTDVTAGQVITAAQLKAGYLRFAPTGNWNGNAPFTYTASDGIFYSTPAATATLAIAAVDGAPSWGAGLADMTIDEMVLKTIDLPSFITDEDDDPTTLVYSFTAAPDTDDMGIDPVTKAFVWTPNELQGEGVYAVTFTVKDGPTQVSKTINITVKEVDRAPEFTPVEDPTFQEEADNSFEVVAADPDNTDQTVVVTVDNAPVGATFEGTTFSWKPTEDQGAGVYTVTFHATAGGKTTNMPVKITVAEVNKLPVFTPVADQTFAEETAKSFTVTAVDSDNTHQTVTITALDAPTGATFNGTTFTWTPAENQGPDDITVTFKASDGVDYAVMTVNIHVDEVNKAPVFDAIAAKKVKQGDTLTFTIHAADADLPAQELVYEADGALPGSATFDPDTQIFTWVTNETDAAGDYTAKFNVTDGMVVTPLEVKITVRLFNTAPVINNTNIPIKELANATIPLSATDVDGDTVILGVEGALPIGAKLTNGVITWKPTEAQGPADYPVVITADDGIAPVVKKTITIHVDEVNAAPTFTKTSYDTSVMATEKVQIIVEATDSDNTNQKLTYAVKAGTTLPSFLAFDAQTRTLSGTPSLVQDGTYTVVLTVSDGVATTQISVKITVSVNQIFLPALTK